MSTPAVVTRHAEVRAHERLNLDASALLALIEEGRGVRLGSTAPRDIDSGTTAFVRGAYLLFLPNRDEYCLVVTSNVDRAVITVLTEDQALNSRRWGHEITEVTRVRARERAGMKVGAVEKLHARVLDGVPRVCYFRVRTFDQDWSIAFFTACKLNVAVDQIDEVEKRCVLTAEQLQTLHGSVDELLGSGQMKPYAEFFLKHKLCGDLLIDFTHPGVGSLADGEVVRRWGVSR